MPKRRAQAAGKLRRPAKTIKFLEDNGDFAEITKRVAALTVVQGSEVDLGTQVLCEQPVTIGRDAEVELPLRDGSISRRHCRVEHDAAHDRWLLSDLGSTNGTRVNGNRVAPDEPVALADGDKIFLGVSVVKFGFRDELDARYHAWLESAAATDALTGLPSSRKFDAAYRHAVTEAREAGAPLGVLVMDLDGLKQVNDAHGHQTGGFVLAEVAAILRATIEPHGAVTRFGGDEFMSFLPGHDRRATVALAERARAAVAGHAFVREDVTVRTTISIGVACLPDDATDPDELFRVADGALYRAKAAGRDRVA
jgi:diguanylate cyclase (GGDEF)-like protein